MNQNNILILLSVILILIIVYGRNEIETFVNTLSDGNFRNLIKIKSKINGKDYNVQENFPDQSAAADMLAHIDDTMLKFIKLLQQKYPNRPEIQDMIAKIY